jgi:hypothetical protein
MIREVDMTDQTHLWEVTVLYVTHQPFKPRGP